MSKLHALIIGINNYAPESGVSDLSGCVNDATNVEAFLKEHFKDVLTKSSIKKLLNKEATRENIITTFQNHLIKKAKSGDTVLFYYAGHGSHTESAEIFKKFDGKEQDETFVCYDSRLPGHHDLADKEIAVLLSRIKTGVHTIVIADSCHSASITRGRLGKSRFYAGRIGERSLSSYMLDKDNYYQDLMDNNSAGFAIPHSSHLLISGCDRDESSFETDDRRGLFTTRLLEILDANQDISYKNLFESVRLSVLEGSDNDQRPTINAYEGFNPNTVFLRSDIKPNTRHIIKFEDNKWQMEYGALFGLPSDPNKAKDIKIGIYKKAASNAKFILQSSVEKVNLTNLWLTDSEGLEKTEKYWGEIQNIPSPMVVNLVGTKTIKKAFLTAYNKEPSPFFQFSDGFDKAKYALQLGKEKSFLVIAKTDKIVFEVGGHPKEKIKTIKDKTEHVARWETTANLENKDENTSLSKAVELKFFEEQIENKISTKTEIEGTDIILDYYKAGQDKVKNRKGQIVAKPLYYQIHAQNVSDQPLYISLLYLSASYGVESFWQSQELAAKSGWKEIDNSHALKIDNPDSDHDTEIFKVIISNKPFDEHKYLLPNLERSDPTTRSASSRDEFFDTIEEEEKEDWYTKTLTVHLIRKNTEIGREDVSLKKEGIVFNGHDKVTADFAFASVNGKSKRSVKPWDQINQYVNKEGLTLINLAGKTRDAQAQDKTVIELSNLNMKKEALKDKPLSLTVNQPLAENESIVPVTFDGEFLIPLGYSEKKEDGSIKVSINHLPSYDDTSRKRKKRSVTKAAWFVLLKMVGLEDSAYKVRWVKYKPDGTVDRNTLRLKQKVNQADKILLVTHGIIGDTKPMIKNLEFLLTNKHYDLILTYDYENLTTDIKNIAVKLNERLKKLGLGANDGKTLHIMAHSMGGLVSRHMIEKIRGGDDMIDHIYMFGTPNGGSPFGEIPKFRDKLIALLSIGMNFGVGLGWIGVAMGMANKALLGSKLLTQTLEQMSGEDDFILELAKSTKGHAGYTIVAGNVNEFKPTDDGRFARFRDKVLLKVGNYASSDDPNDVAVVVKDILAIPFKSEQHTIACHHMNYFEDGVGLDKLKEVMIGEIQV